jgi:hypothetical protein
MPRGSGCQVPAVRGGVEVGDVLVEVRVILRFWFRNPSRVRAVGFGLLDDMLFVSVTKNLRAALHDLVVVDALRT